MKGNRKARQVTLWGRAVYQTEKAVRWHDQATGYELWFPLAVTEIEGDTITVPAKMYSEKVREAEREEQEDERENRRQDREDERELRRDLKEIDRWAKEAPRKATGCLVMVVIGVALVVAVSRWV